MILRIAWRIVVRIRSSVVSGLASAIRVTERVGAAGTTGVACCRSMGEEWGGAPARDLVAALVRASSPFGPREPADLLCALPVGTGAIDHLLACFAGTLDRPGHEVLGSGGEAIVELLTAVGQAGGFQVGRPLVCGGRRPWGLVEL